jgi:nucleoside-diphosphate-sugar epimerase
LTTPLSTNPTPPKALVSGASGFVGRTVCQVLLAAGWQVIGQVGRQLPPPGVTPLPLDWAQHDAIANRCPPVDAIIHLAGLAHVPVSLISHERIWRINVETTRHLAHLAAENGIPLIFLSSAKVLGEQGEWNDNATPAPSDLYAESKLAAEETIRATHGLDYSILRPPLIYGPQVKANFLRLLRWADRGWPLPLAGLDNPRSLLYVENLADAILSCLATQQRPAASQQTWLISDGPPLSVASLFRHLAAALQRPARLFPFPRPLLHHAAAWLGKTAEIERLTGRFILHDQALRSQLGWAPPHTTAAGLQRTVQWFRQTQPTATPGSN